MNCLKAAENCDKADDAEADKNQSEREKIKRFVNISDEKNNLIWDYFQVFRLLLPFDFYSLSSFSPSEFAGQFWTKWQQQT